MLFHLIDYFSFNESAWHYFSYCGKASSALAAWPPQHAFWLLEGLLLQLFCRKGRKHPHEKILCSQCHWYLLVPLMCNKSSFSFWILLCNLSISSWIQSCVALRSMLALVHFLAQLKGGKAATCMWCIPDWGHLSVLLHTWPFCLCWAKTGVSVFTWLGENSSSLGA